MTEPTGGPPAPEGQGSWQAPPPPSGGFMAQVAPGPAPGVSYADLLPRIIALFIDAIILGVLYAIVVSILAFLGEWPGFIVSSLLYIGGSVLYFVYTWTRQRASPGQRLLRLETVNAADGATLTQDQAIRRWLYLWGPSSLAQVVSYGGGWLLGPIGWVLSLAAFVYEVYLLYSATQSPKRQGFHDVQAATVVVRRG